MSVARRRVQEEGQVCYMEGLGEFERRMSFLVEKNGDLRGAIMAGAMLETLEGQDPPRPLDPFRILPCLSF